MDIVGRSPVKRACFAIETTTNTLKVRHFQKGKDVNTSEQKTIRNRYLIFSNAKENNTSRV